MSETGLKIAQQHSGKVCIVALIGRVDNTTASRVQAQLKTLIDAGEKATHFRRVQPPGPHRLRR